MLLTSTLCDVLLDDKESAMWKSGKRSVVREFQAGETVIEKDLIGEQNYHVEKTESRPMPVVYSDRGIEW